MEDTTSLWNKKQEDLTVGESFKVGAGAAIVSLVVPVVTLIGVGAAASAWEKFQTKRAAKKATKVEEQ